MAFVHRSDMEPSRAALLCRFPTHPGRTPATPPSKRVG